MPQCPISVWFSQQKSQVSRDTINSRHFHWNIDILNLLSVLRKTNFYLKSSLVILTDSCSPLINLTPSMPRNKFQDKSTVLSEAFSAIVRPSKSPFVNLFPL